MLVGKAPYLVNEALKRCLGNNADTHNLVLDCLIIVQGQLVQKGFELLLALLLIGIITADSTQLQNSMQQVNTT